MGVNAAEVREMVAEARSRGIFLMEVSLEGPSDVRKPSAASSKHGCPSLPTVKMPPDQNLGVARM